MQSNRWDPSMDKLPRRQSQELPRWQFKAEWGYCTPSAGQYHLISSNRMRTSRLETIRASVSVCQHQMSLVGGGGRSLDLISGGNSVPYHVTYPMMHLVLPTASPCRKTDAER